MTRNGTLTLPQLARAAVGALMVVSGYLMVLAMVVVGT